MQLETISKKRWEAQVKATKHELSFAVGFKSQYYWRDKWKAAL